MPTHLPSTCRRGLLALGIAACGDGGEQTTGSGTTNAPTSESASSSGDPTAATEPGTATGSSGTSTSTSGTPTTGTGSTSASSTGDDACAGGSLCGEPATCCPAGNECVEQVCLPECPSGTRCGDDLSMCCEVGQVCSGAACVLPGLDCLDSYDCPADEYCEPVLGKCLPQPDPVTCEYVPDFTDINVTLEWSWIEGHVISLPVVADLEGDGVPDVVFTTTQEAPLPEWPKGLIVALDGATGAQKFKIPHSPNEQSFGSHGRSSIALGDVSGDGLPDIIYAGRPDGNGRSPIHAVDGAGKLLWTSHDANNVVVRTGVDNGGASLANFDDDPQAEVVFGATLYDHDGLRVWTQGVDGGLVGAPASYPGGLASIVDVDGDGAPEIVTGKQAWSVQWTPGNPPVVQVQELWNNADGTDGWPAIADLDQNGTPEVILAATGKVRVLDAATGLLWCGVDPTGVVCNNDPTKRTAPYDLPQDAGLGGPPTIADFDGDGRPEVGVAGASRYTVLDLHRAGEEVVKPMADPMPAMGAIYRRWAAPTKDESSNATGSSVFDFQGDGAAEVTYNDECYMRVYDGKDGTERLKIENSSSTIHEYPVVADVDGDGESEILVVANNNNNTCPAQGYQSRRGVFLYGDAGDGWVPTRKVWTSHTYHVSDVTSAGNPPMIETDNWTTEGLNNYRQNVQPDGVFNAPDLTVQLALSLEPCPQKIDLVATVRNEGALGVKAGVKVDFYQGVDATGTLLGTLTTTGPLLPGASEKVILQVIAPPNQMSEDYYVEVDEPSKGDGAVLECDETNNTSLATSAKCSIPQ